MPVGMTQRSPRKVAQEGTRENHIGTRAQTWLPRAAAAAEAESAAWSGAPAAVGVAAPEAASRQLDRGVAEAPVAQPERGVPDIEYIPTAPKPKSTEDGGQEVEVLLIEAVGDVGADQSPSLWGGGS
mmetsp:Transcript_29406/g.62586  ORF Transcript_29406/g.62586 Transcript_29406/m.62586 type:complete len:127 (-) Transcript_29406:1142-1522(-)